MNTSVDIAPVIVAIKPDDHEYIRIVCAYCGHSTDVPVYCGNRFCNVCSSQRQKRVKGRINWLIKHRNNRSGTMLKHLTLTVRNDVDLAKMVKHLVKSFRRLRQRKYFKQHVIGGAFVVELTEKGNRWHAHIHCVIQSYRIDIHELFNLWFKCSEGNTGVFIQNIPAYQAVAYLTKYISKSDLPEDKQIIASSALKNYRLFNPFGEWYAINRTYVQPECPCPECNTTGNYLPYDLVYGDWAGRFG